MAFVTTSDGIDIYYTEHGSGQPIVLSHGWPLNSDAWQLELKLFADAGYRAIAHDRRGHGRSSKTYSGNDMETYAKDLAAVVDSLDLHDLIVRRPAAMVYESPAAFPAALLGRREKRARDSPPRFRQPKRPTWSQQQRDQLEQGCHILFLVEHISRQQHIKRPDGPARLLTLGGTPVKQECLGHPARQT